MSIVEAEKLRVFQSLPTIGKNLGAEECQKTLAPMLSDLVQKAIGAGDDEVLMVISQKLPDLAEVLVPVGEGASSLIPIISDILVFVEEIVVAQTAADAFCAILPHLSADQIDKKALPLIRKLQEDDLFCASKKVVSKMIISCYPLVPPKVRSELKWFLTSGLLGMTLALRPARVSTIGQIGTPFALPGSPPNHTAAHEDAANARRVASAPASRRHQAQYVARTPRLIHLLAIVLINNESRVVAWHCTPA
ncbi:unnamed protein product [Mesocestoides corti]|uniref:Symplekin/Pta1 N-terminal domain-containing protein n=3 Tax=Mesocestoides corti TaxID=53468 RepID=A0A0R3U7B9_MESCO|nr:unnamed protein product [Mesocestoides corti]